MGGTIGAIAVLTVMIVIALVVFKRHRRSINNSIQGKATVGWPSGTLPLNIADTLAAIEIKSLL